MAWHIGNSVSAGGTVHNPSIIRDDDGHSICQIYGVALHCTLAEAQASEACRAGLERATLISAAPDLLAACRAALGAFENNDCIDWNILAVAIDKAEGKRTDETK